jgi:hypothetical protein
MSRAILLNKRRKKKPVSLPRYTLSQAATDQMNQDNSLSSIMNTDAFKLSRGDVNADGYIDQFMPPPPVLYSNPEENDFGQLDYKPRPSLEINYVGQEDSTSPRVNASNAYGMPAKYKAILEAEAADKALVDEANAVLDGVEGNGFEDYTLSNATQPVSYENERYNSLPLQNNQDDPVNDMVAGENLFPYTRVPDGHHRMRDGSIMADSEMKEDGVLGNNNKAPSNNKGVLNTDTTSSNDRKGSVVSANARGSMMPFAKINRNEALMRIGGAMVGGSSQGFSGAMKAATDEFGNIQDANRQAETDAFNKAEATRLAEARIQAQKDKADKNKKAMGMPSAVYKQAALTAITDIKGRLANESGFNPFDNNTGLFGYAMSHVAGTDAHDTANAIDTIEASIGFDRLQKMRDDSPTGGALGQVSNIELALLRKSLGSLKQSSSRAQFIKNLNSIETQYKKAVAAVEAQQREWYRMQGVDVPEPVNNSAEPAVVGGYSIVTKQK